WPGGSQEGGFRPGTEATLLILAMGAAASLAEKMRASYAQVAAVRDHFEKTINAACDARIIGQNLHRLPNTSAITFNISDPDALRIACDMAGLSVGFGSACSGLAPEGSFALSSMGLSLAAQKSTVRFSFTADATQNQADEAARRMIGIAFRV
ncbi:MAG TPA: aminotransferase class V-fold PLP-dependent enzyme, partial [Myxococcota bacterium]|nr:aminotransferase class V-fold PLP-dependent enzyme [Myxococcota bacterium]